MVASQILKAQEIIYPETNRLDVEDKDHQSALYIIELLDTEYVVAIGAPRMQYADKGVIYYPIYLMSPKNRIKAKIGIFEVETKKTISIVDDEGDIDLNKLGDPLLFSFVSTEYLKKNGSSGPNNPNISIETPLKKGEENGDAIKYDDEDENENENENEDEYEGDDKEKTDPLDIDDDDDDEMFKIPKIDEESQKVSSSVLETDNDKPLTLNDVFDKDEVLPTVPSWPIETEEDAKKMRDFYKKNKSAQDSWIVKYMRNKNYKILSNEGGGDCFFAAIRDAYAQIGHKTTVQKLRKILSQEVTIELYENYKEIYDGLKAEIESTEEELQRLQTINSDLKKQSDKTMESNKQKEIINEAVKVKQKYTKQNVQKGGTKELLDEFMFMENIHSVEDLKQFIQTPDYWANTWGVSTLELLLNMKVIVLESTDDLDNAMRCTQANDELSVYANYDPQYYIIVNYTGGLHYEVVSYKDKKIFKFGEVPYDIKIKVIQKCIENNDQSYYTRIPAFRQFRKDLGIPEISQSKSTDDEDGVDLQKDRSDLFDPEITISFHANSDKKKKPGDVDADYVPYRRRSEFSQLVGFDLWRKRLDDDWMEDSFSSPDGRKWSSVSHYLLAVPFKESHPAVYEEFSLDSKSELSADIAKARLSTIKKAGKEGKHYNLFHKSAPLEKEVLEVHRKDALRSKFKPDTEMGRLLKATNLAKLVNRRKRTLENDISLMEIRKEIEDTE